ncbi:MAG: TonB-dependent receptor [Terriglobales bacterium]
MRREVMRGRQLREKIAPGRCARFLAELGIIFCLISASFAQKDRSAVNGTVADSSGRVLPKVKVLALQNDTGLRREAVSSASGTYDIPELPVGTYVITFSHPGFKSLRFEGVAQNLGQTRTLNVTLQVAGTAEQVEVSGVPQSLDQTNNTLGTDIERKQAEELPLNGQNWATLTALGPGAVDTSGSSGGGNQRSIRFAGRGRDDNNFTYDGVDATNIINQAQQPYVRLAIPIDTIQEFRVDPMLATAESGGTGGGQLAVASPSGTNRFHGDAYEFIRNRMFDALEPIDALNPHHQPPFHLNQFGGSVGGPIVRNRTFFFAAYEGYRQDLGQTLVGYVPSASFRAQVLAQSPQLAPIINAYPQGQTLISPNIAQFVGEGRQVGEENSGMFRIDHRFSDATAIFVRANIDLAVSTIPYSPITSQYLNGREQLTSDPVNSTIALTHVFSPTLLNQVKFGFNRSTANTAFLNQTGSLYAITVSGFTTLNNGRVSTGAGNSFSGIDDLTWVKGKHVVKAGAEVRRIQMNQGSSTFGTITFNTLAGFAADVADQAKLTGTLPVNGLRKTQYFGYLQDEIKLRSNFTLNLGARYSFFDVFHEVQGRGNPFDFATCGPQGYCGVGASFGQPNYGDIDPRVAFAWAPARFGGKTVIRSGFGIYHEDGQLDDQNLPDKNEVINYTLTGVPYPIAVGPGGNPVSGAGTVSITPNAEQRRRKDTYVTQWGLSVEQALPADFVGTIAYVGSEGTHLLSLSYVNVKDLVTGLRPYPAFGQVSWRGTIGNSSYEGLSVGVKRSFTRGLLFSAYYMWSHEIDDDSNGSGDGDSITPQNVSCPPASAPCAERASGAFDARHVFNANGVWELPFGPGKAYLNEPGALRAMFGSWSFSTIFTAHTGFPVNVIVNRTGPDGNNSDQRPNLVAGVPLYLSGGNFNPTAFAAPAAGTFGDVPRNFLRGRGVWQSDMGLAKRIPIREQLQLHFRAEVFNVFNKALYASPDGNISDSSFGLIQSPLNPTPVGMGTPRQFQFMLKAQF